MSIDINQYEEEEIESVVIFVKIRDEFKKIIVDDELSLKYLGILNNNDEFMKLEKRPYRLISE